MTCFDAINFPCSHIVESAGRTRFVPGFNLVRVGLWRAEREWPDGNRRNARVQLDCIHLDVLSPWTFEQMRLARDVTAQLLSSKDLWNGELNFSGMQVKHSDALRGRRLHEDAIRCWPAGMVVARLEQYWMARGVSSMLHGLHVDWNDSPEDWCDAGGMLVRRSRIMILLSGVQSCSLSDLDELDTTVRAVCSCYNEHSWCWCLQAWRQEFGNALAPGSATVLCAATEHWRNLSLRFLDEIVQDAEKDLATSIMWTHTPYAVTEGTLSIDSSHQGDTLLRTLTRQRRDVLRRSTKLLLQRVSDRIVTFQGA